MVYLPKGKYCVYPRMVYRLAPGIMKFFTLKIILRVIPHHSYLGKDSFTPKKLHDICNTFWQHFVTTE